MQASPLQGKVIATLEARRAAEMASLIQRQGGVPYSAPALREVPLGNQAEVAAFLRAFTTQPVSAMVCLTGVGTRALLETANALGRLPEVLAALQKTTVVARGPKPVRVLKEYGVRIDYVPPEPNTSRELVQLLQPLGLEGKLVALQHYGEPNTFLREALLELGARLLEVSLYRWDLPEDQSPLLRFLADVQRGAIHVVAGTSKRQVQNLFAVAEHFGQEDGLRQALNGAVAVAAVGPVCAQAWEDHGVAVDILPQHPTMGHLVLAIGEYCRSQGVPKGRAVEGSDRRG